MKLGKSTNSKLWEAISYVRLFAFYHDGSMHKDVVEKLYNNLNSMRLELESKIYIALNK